MSAEEAKLFAKQGAKIIALAHDISSANEWKTVVETAVSQYGTVDILVNNAGIGGKNQFGNPENTELDEWDLVMNMNLKSSF